MTKTKHRNRPRRAAVWIERGLMALIAAGSVAWTLWWMADLARLPGAALLVERTGSELAAAYERDLARTATPEALAARLSARLDEAPRDWVVIDALVVLAREQGIALPPDLLARRGALNAEDNGWIATGLSCARCAWDLGRCALSAALTCGIAVNMTPVGDIVALTREGGHLVLGAEVDRVDAGLALVGLAATGLVVATGGSSLSVKAGAALLRVAHRTGRLAPEVVAVFRRAFAEGIDWARLPLARNTDDLARLARPAALRPALELSQDLGQLNARLGPRQTLHLMGAIDGAEDAARLARAAEALGPRTLGALEMLGKSRFMRLGLRLADEVWAALAGLFAALASGAALLAPLLARLGRPMGRAAVRALVRGLFRARPG